MAPAVRDAVREIDPEQPIARLRTLDDWIARSLQGRRAPMTLVGLFGVLALVLAAVGIYGVVAFGVAERVREFGLRQALGAQPSSILRMVLGQAARTAGVGIAAGLIAAFAGSRALASMLFDVTPHDPAIFAGTAALLFVVGVLACLVPARRATRVDPMVALREC
jgi:ABC-type antimicrobial peptide transport system permease subunit